MTCPVCGSTEPKAIHDMLGCDPKLLAGKDAEWIEDWPPPMRGREV